MTLPSYALVTPARDEAEFIELTLRSVLSQTLRPLKWVIVSDGSSDGTDRIVERHIPDNPWIELIRMPERRERHFGGKAHAFNAGLKRLTGVPYDVIGNLDGDVSFEPDYFEFLMARFAENPGLGVGGTPFREGAFQYDYRFTSIEHVSGQCQMFRRECFDQIGGYVPRKIGGIDLVAVVTARMKGWQTRTFTDKTYNHHRIMSTATQSRWRVPFKGGRADYVLGCHPVWEICRCIYQTTKPPIPVGGLFRFAGYIWASATTGKEVPPEFVRFRRAEQMRRLWKFIARR